MDEVKNIEIKTMLAWALSLILAWFFLTSGYPKINPSSEFSDRFISWGYSTGFAQTIGIIEIVCGVLILIPKVRFWSSIALVVVMIGAIYTHITTGIGSPAFAVILLILAMILVVISNPFTNSKTEQ